VETDTRSLAAVLTRTAAMLFIAVLLILVLLPAALAASGRDHTLGSRERQPEDDRFDAW
jgi:hypothetical protein